MVKTGGTFEGFATGFLQTGENGFGRPEFLKNGTSHIVLDPKTNTVTANITADHSSTTQGREFLPEQWLRERFPVLNLVPDKFIPDVTLSSETNTDTNYNLGFVGSGDSEYVNDDVFLALGDDGSTRVVRDTATSGTVDVEKFKILREELGPFHVDIPILQQTEEYANVQHNGALVSLPGSALCEDCSFMKFGTWASDVTFGDHTEKMGGWWVASNDQVKSVGDLPTQGSAFYAGNAVGTFAKRIDGTWQQGVGTGGVSLDWDFAKRSGDLRVANFGNELGHKSFRGTVSSPQDVVGFAGDITNGGKGTLRGTFVGPRAGLPPQAVMGDFNARGGNWRANGVYGAAHVPNGH